MKYSWDIKCGWNLNGFMDPMVIKCGWTIPERNRGSVRKIIELNGGFSSHVCQRVWDRDGIDVRYAMPSDTLMVDHVG